MEGGGLEVQLKLEPDKIVVERKADLLKIFVAEMGGLEFAQNIQVGGHKKLQSSKQGFGDKNVPIGGMHNVFTSGPDG